MLPKIAVLITCYNRKDKTIGCLAALFKQAGMHSDYQLEVFLTDDASTDGTADAVSALYPQINIIKGNGQLFWNRGMHAAWQAALNKQNYDFFLWLNDDTQLMTDGLLEMLACEKEKNNKALVCAAIRSFSEEKFSYGGRLKNGDSITPNGKIQECFNINGNCVLISKKTYEAIGILDPTFPHAIGDLDYGLRAKKAGISVITTRKYVGFCDCNDLLPKWCYNTTPLNKRFKALYSPLGYSHPYYFFIYEKRYFGIFTALKHYFSIHLRALIPSLWK